MNYQRYDCIWAGEGPIPNEVLQQVLAPYTVIEPPEEEIPEWHIRAALVTQMPFKHLMVFNGKAHLTQKYTGVYLASGEIGDAFLEELRADQQRYIVDFSGDLLIAPTEQVWAEQDRLRAEHPGPVMADPRVKWSEFSQALVGVGKREIMEG